MSLARIYFEVTQKLKNYKIIPEPIDKRKSYTSSVICKLSFKSNNSYPHHIDRMSYWSFIKVTEIQTYVKFNKLNLRIIRIHFPLKATLSIIYLFHNSIAKGFWIVNKNSLHVIFALNTRFYSWHSHTPNYNHEATLVTDGDWW